MLVVFTSAWRSRARHLDSARAGPALRRLSVAAVRGDVRPGRPGRRRHRTGALLRRAVVDRPRGLGRRPAGAGRHSTGRRRGRLARGALTGLVPRRRGARGRRPAVRRPPPARQGQRRRGRHHPGRPRARPCAHRRVLRALRRSRPVRAGRARALRCARAGAGGRRGADVLGLAQPAPRRDLGLPPAGARSDRRPAGGACPARLDRLPALRRAPQHRHPARHRPAGRAHRHPRLLEESA